MVPIMNKFFSHLKCKLFSNTICGPRSKKILNKNDKKVHFINDLDKDSLQHIDWPSPLMYGSKFGPDESNILSEILELTPKDRILDSGFGMGRRVNELTQKGFEVTGIDSSENVINDCKKHYLGSFQKVTTLPSPFGNESFDTVIFANCLEYIAEKDLKLAVIEISRLTRRQAYLRIAICPAGDEELHLTTKSRKWWEFLFLSNGFRLHPITQMISPFESLESDKKEITLCLEKIPQKIQFKYSKEWLAQRRDLHTDMSRESNRRSDAHIARYQLAREICPIKGQVLDAACGMGYGSNVLSFARSELKVTGIDISKEAIEYSTNNFSSLNKNLKFKIGGVEELNTLFKNETFDMVCSFETVEHINDPVSFIHDVKNMLKPKGLFICSVPNMWVDESGKDPNPHHLHVFDFEKIISIVSEELEPQKIYSQIAGNGNKFPEKPRTLMEHNLESDLSSIEAEWCIILAKKF